MSQKMMNIFFVVEKSSAQVPGSRHWAQVGLAPGPGSPTSTDQPRVNRLAQVAGLVLISPCLFGPRRIGYIRTVLGSSSPTKGS